MQTNTENRGNAQLAGHQILQIVNPALQVPKDVHHLITRLEKSAALWSQSEILPSPLDELDAESTLQCAYLLAYSALRNSVHLCRLGKTRGFRQIGEDF